MRAVTAVALAFALAVASGHRSVAAQSGLDLLSGLGGFMGSFRATNGYVGAVAVSLKGIPAVKKPVRLHGFSVTSPGGPGWYFAASNERGDVLQTAWFVRDPERFSDWSRRKQLTTRPLSLIARLRFLGRLDSSQLAGVVRSNKTAEWSGEGIRDLTLNVVLDTSGDHPCANYDGRAVDERVPKGFLPGPYAVTFSGRVCPHPAAPWLAVDIGSTRRTPESEAVVPTEPLEAGFAASLRMETFEGPIVEDVLVLDAAEAADGAGYKSRITGTAISPGSVWISQAFDRPPNGTASASPRPMLSRIDVTSNRVVARVPIDGQLAGVAAGTVWISGRNRGWRLEPATNEITQEFPASCPPGTSEWSDPLRAGDYGVWLPCRVPDQKQSMFVMRRLDVATAGPMWDLRVSGGGDMQASGDHVWVLDGWRVKPCRVHEIDLSTQQLLRTLVVGSFECSAVTIDGNTAWALRDFKEVVKVDMAKRAIVAVAAVGPGRAAYDLAVAEDTVWVATQPSVNSPPGGLDLGSPGGVVTIDRATGRVRHAAIPTGSAFRLVGVDRRTAWLYSPNGVIVRIVDR